MASGPSPERHQARIVYDRDLAAFRRDVSPGDNDRILLDELKRALGRGPAAPKAWHQSLSQMHITLDDPEAISRCTLATACRTSGTGARSAATLRSYRVRFFIRRETGRPTRF